ncbi:MAG: DUF2807 domain-containing protein [Paludibacteraceae bacterium]|nr:DUF2807 domain-containing protein [Paludibacteraceae bacterium]
MKKSVKSQLFVMAGALVMAGMGMLSSCNPNYGEITNKALTIGAYEAIDVSNGVDIEMSADILAPVLTTNELIMDKVRVEVEHGTLVIELKDMIYTTKISELKVVLPLNPELKKVTASGASRVEVKGTVPLNELHLSGASTADFDAIADMKKIEMSGMSRAELAGLGDKVEIDISGASDLDAQNLLVSEITGSVSGASFIDVTICTKLAVDASGASGINYGLVSPTCEPTIDCNLTGGAKIYQR